MPMQHQSLLNHLRVQALFLKMKSTLYHFPEGSLRRFYQRSNDHSRCEQDRVVFRSLIQRKSVLNLDPMEITIKINLIKENLSANCVGNIELRMRVNKPEVEETIFTTGAAVRESES